MRKKSLALSVVAMMILSCLFSVPALAAGDLEVTIGNASENIGDEISIPISITSNPGIAGYTLNITYDHTKMTYTGAVDGGNALSPMAVGEQTTGTIKMTMGRASNSSSTGLLATLKFTAVAAVVDSEISINASSGAADATLTSVSVSPVIGKVTITGAPVTIPTITVGTTSGSTSQTVTVPVSIANNPGIAGYVLNITYDETKLTYTGFDNGTAGLNPLAANSQGSGVSALVKVTAGQASNVSGNGVLFSLKFTVKAGAAAGQIPLAVTGSLADDASQNVTYTPASGSITVSPTITPIITVGTASGSMGQTVTIPVSIANNSGIAGYVLNITYDETKLTYAGFDNGTAGLNPLAANSQGSGVSALVKVTAGSASNVSGNGVLFSLKFTVKAGAAAGQIPLTVTGSLANAALQNASYSPASGSITITAAPPAGSTYIITFDAGIGGSVSPSSAITDTNGKLSSLPTPTRASYTFNGWYTAASGGMQITTDTVFTSDRTVYAQWTPASGIVYTLTVNAGAGGTASGGTSNTTGAFSITASPNTNYSFNGWTISSGNGTFGNAVNASTTFTITSGTTATVKANFTYNSGGGGGSSSGGGTPTNPVATPTPTTPVIPTTAKFTLNGKSIDLALNADGSVTLTAANLAGLSQPIILGIPYNTSGNLNINVAVMMNGQNNIIPMSAYKDGVMYLLVSEAGTYGVSSNAKAFSDVSGHWALDYIDFVAARTLYSGDGTGKFDPNGAMTRAMFVRVIANLEGANVSNSIKSRFSDVTSGQWYTGAVEWAADNNIVAGVGNGKFDPNVNITREQMAVMLMNYTMYKGYTLSSSVSASTFTDEDEISAWALDAVNAVQRAGIVSGRPGNLFDPKDIATRAEVATIFAKFIEKMIVM